MRQKLLLLLLFFAVLSLNVYAHNPAIAFMGEPLFRKVTVTPLQLTVWPLMLCREDVRICGIHLAASPLGYQARLYGISAGVILGSGKLYGLSVSGASFGGDNYGLSIALYNYWSGFSAVSVGLVNVSHSERREKCRSAVQIGIFNRAENGLQIGLLNCNPRAFIPWMPFVNWSSGESSEIPETVKSDI